MKRKLALAVAMSVVAAPVGVVISAVAAQAAVPSCVATTRWNDDIWKMVRATNNCSSSQRFYFQWDRAVDGDCTTLAAGYRRDEGRVYTARFAGLASC